MASVPKTVVLQASSQTFPGPPRSTPCQEVLNPVERPRKHLAKEEGAQGTGPLT